MSSNSNKLTGLRAHLHNPSFCRKLNIGSFPRRLEDKVAMFTRVEQRFGFRVQRHDSVAPRALDFVFNDVGGDRWSF